MSTALGDAGAAKATRRSPGRCGSCWPPTSSTQTVVRPEINGVLADNGIEGSDVPKSVFLPEGDQMAGRKRGRRRARRGQRLRPAPRPRACTGSD